MSEYTYKIEFRPGHNFFHWQVDVFRDNIRLGGPFWTDLARTDRQARRSAKRIIRKDRKYHDKVYTG